MQLSPPELNMEMDSYRVGSLLELVREMALGFARAGLRTRVCVRGPTRHRSSPCMHVLITALLSCLQVCVQGSMGQGAFTGVPRVLSGVTKLLTMMDWQAEEGEEYEGLLTGSTAAQGEGAGAEGGDVAGGGASASEALVRFGAVGASEVGATDDVLLVIAPQSMVRASIQTRPLACMCSSQRAALHAEYGACIHNSSSCMHVLITAPSLACRWARASTSRCVR